MTKQRREQEEETRRRLRWGLLLSLTAHLLFVLGGGWLLPPMRDDGGVVDAGLSLQARLMRTAPPAASPSIPARERRALPSSTPASEPQRPLSIPDESLAHAAKAVPPAPTFAAPAASTQTGLAESRQTAPVVAAGATSASSAINPGVGNDGPDANALRGYRLALAVQARRFKRYPAQAQAQAWAGTAEVRLMLAAGGRPETATLERSSGHEVLDRAALEMMNQAVQRTPVPATLQAQAFSISLPIVFSLDE